MLADHRDLSMYSPPRLRQHISSPELHLWVEFGEEGLREFTNHEDSLEPEIAEQIRELIE
jgi:hypothetical protein